MGTTYTVLAKGALRVELDEMSNLFSLDISGAVDNDQPDSLSVSNRHLLDLDAALGEPAATIMSNTACTRRSLKPEDVIGMALEMMKVASYWMDDEDFKIAAATYIKAKGVEASYYEEILELITEDKTE